MATTFVDQITGGGETVAYKAPCRLATTGNITLSGLQSIDGSMTAAGDRVFVGEQDSAVDNGIWIAAAGAWTRARDFDSNRDITKGTRLTVIEGSTLAGKEYYITSANPIAVGTDNITFTETLSSDAGSSAAAAAASAGAALTSETNAAASALASANSVGALAFAFSTTTADADPGAGVFRLNHATIASATAAYVDNVDAAGSGVTAILDSWDDSTSVVRGELTIRAKADATIRHVFRVTGSVVDGTGYRKLTLTYVGGTGTLTNTMPCWLVFDPKGDKGDITLEDVQTYVDNKGPAVVILSTGQSLATYHPALSWSPEPNLYLWNWDGIIHTEDHIGTAFAPMDDASMGYSYAYANMVAKARPMSKVYLINIGRGGKPISEWMVGAGSDSMYDAVKDNVEEALGVLGVDHIDELLWRQGESDVGSITYVGDFNTVIARFQAETWFPIHTPVTIVGMSPIYSGSAAYNFVLAHCAAEEPATRRFASMEALPASYWDPDTVHMTAAGYQASGILAFLAGWSTGDSFYVNPYTKEWVHRYDQAAVTKLTVKNTYAHANAYAAMTVESAQGALYLQALGSLGVAAITWYGAGSLFFQVPDAAGNMIFQTAGTTRLTIAADGTITTTGRLVSSGGALGYTTGAGGTVTQATNKATTVVLNKASGTITMNNASLAANTIVSFVFTNSLIAAGDVLVLNHVSGGTTGAYALNARCVGGGAAIDVRNLTGGALGEAIVIAFALIKGATS